MRHLLFKEQDTYQVAILIKEAAFKKDLLVKHYVKPLESLGVNRDDIIFFTLEYDNPKKVKASTAKAYMERLLPVLQRFDIKHIICCDPNYYKTLCKKTNTEKEHGYVQPSQLKGWEDEFQVAICPNYQGLFHNPDLQTKMDMDIHAMATFMQGTFQELGKDVIHLYEYTEDYFEIRNLLEKLLLEPELTCDVETFSLKHPTAGLGSIAFARNKHEGWTIGIDKVMNRAATFDEQRVCPIRALLRDFFERYEGKVVYHNASFDIKIILFNLWMNHLTDQVGLVKGLNIMTRNFDDTKVITYLATNSTAGNHLGLKDQSHEYTGNYAVDDIDDISLIPKEDLYRYNAIDCMATWYVHEKHWDTVVEDDQLEIYNDIMIPSLRVIIQMELTGMCLDMARVQRAVRSVDRNLRWYNRIVDAHPAVQQVITLKKQRQIEEDNKKLKTKQRTWDEVAYIGFNSGSTKDLQMLLHEVLDYKVHDKTATKQPATGNKTLKKHMSMSCKDDSERNLMKALVGIGDASIIRNNFLKNFLEATYSEEDGAYYIFGNFNLGGTVSGRLSSSGPNLQNIPSSGTPYAKMIKKCFIAPPGFVFVGADFASLEDRISALTTRDPMKLKVYTDGYDGHCLRAYHYFPTEYVGIPETPAAINATKGTHKKWRQLSKTPTFALTYGGTYMAIVEQTGMPVDDAKAIEANYHKLYSASDAWVEGHVKKATTTGYVTCAFGLRVRTPILAKTILGLKETPYEAQKEARTAGNALGQSWGLLNNRAAIELQTKTLKSPFVLDIRPCAHIHDAQYFYVRDDVAAVEYLNNNLGDAMAWQNHPLIQHPDVHLSGELDLFYPSWAYDKTLPNHASQDLIFKIADASPEEYKQLMKSL